MEKQQNKIFANCSQTVRNHCEFRNVLATSFALRNSIAPIHCTFAKFASHKTLAKFRIAKIRNVLATLTNFAMPISQCEFRNANFAMPISQCQFRNANFAMPISQGQFRNANFAMPISQGQYTVHLSHIKHQNLSEISHCEIRKPLCEIRKPIAKFANHFANFTSFAKFTFAGLVILCN